MYAIAIIVIHAYAVSRRSKIRIPAKTHYQSLEAARRSLRLAKNTTGVTVERISKTRVAETPEMAPEMLVKDFPETRKLRTKKVVEHNLPRWWRIKVLGYIAFIAAFDHYVNSCYG